MKTSLEIKSTVYSQIHLGYYSEHLPVKSGALDSSVCKLCGKLKILHCKTLFDALDYFQPLILELGKAEVDKKELVFGMQEYSNREMLRNIITFRDIKSRFLRKLPLLPLLWHTNAIDEN